MISTVTFSSLEDIPTAVFFFAGFSVSFYVCQILLSPAILAASPSMQDRVHSLRPDLPSIHWQGPVSRSLMGAVQETATTLPQKQSAPGDVSVSAVLCKTSSCLP